MPETAGRVDAVVVGAGVVGLAVARELARRGLEVLVLERRERPGMETTARNSEVVHGSLYYRPGSLKARLCAPGRGRLYEYCASRGIAHRRIGKYVVATSAAEVPRLEAYLENGRSIGAEGLELVDASALRAAEPAVRAVAALWSPASGIVDSDGLVRALQADVEAHGGTLACRATVERVAACGSAYEVHVRQAGEEFLRLETGRVVNAAGHGACALAACIEGLPASAVPTARHARGRYYVLRGRSPFSHLVYPLPEPGALGVHVTLDLAGRARFGPDVEWIDGEDYAFDDSARERFVDSIARYWPEVTSDRLEPGYTGIRPRVQWPVGLAEDFVIQEGRGLGLPGVVNLYGIESPGLTASLALGELVANTVVGEGSPEDWPGP